MMKDGRLIVNASNCHSGGGKIQKIEIKTLRPPDLVADVV